MYVIDKLALRAENEKIFDKEADTVRCYSLKYEHVTLEPLNKVTSDFLDKESIRYNETTHIDAQVFKNLKPFKKPLKTDGDDLFDRLTVNLRRGLGWFLPNDYEITKASCSLRFPQTPRHANCKLLCRQIIELYLLRSSHSEFVSRY